MMRMVLDEEMARLEFKRKLKVGVNIVGAEA